MLDCSSLTPAMAGATGVPSRRKCRRRFGTDPRRTDQNVIATFNAGGHKKERRAPIAFSSTGSIYGADGHAGVRSAFPVQTSSTGASKLAGEGSSGVSRGFRLPGLSSVSSQSGERGTHGYVFHFYRSLRANPSGSIRRASEKSYSTCRTARRDPDGGGESAGTVNIFNLGTDHLRGERLGWLDAEHLTDRVLTYTGGERGWAGDSPFIFLDTANSRAWLKPTLTIREGIIRTLQYLEANCGFWRIRQATPK